MGRIILAGIAGGVVMFFWGFVAHMVLPIGDMGIKLAPGEDAALAGLSAGMQEPGVYLLPGFNMKADNNEEHMKAFGEKAAASPNAFVVYNPTGRNSMNMGPMLGRQFASDTLGALIAAIIVSFTVAGIAQRTILVSMMGCFGWLGISLPYWNWYRFPLDFTVGSLLEQGIGWLLAGFAIALVMKNRRPA